MVAPRLDDYMGHAFERVAGEAYTRVGAKRKLPIAREWGRWEGNDRAGRSLAQSGVKWAHDAKRAEAPLLYVAAGGFTKEFVNAARASRDEVHLWALDDLYKGRAKR